MQEIVGGLPDHSRYLPQPERPRPRGHGRTNTSRLIEGACRVVREAENGERNSRLNWAAYALGQRIAAGELDEDVTTPLLQAALDVGLPSFEAMRTIASGLSAATGSWHDDRPRRSLPGGRG